MAEIKLSNGYTTLVDDSDLAMLVSHKWSAMKAGGDKVYAVRTARNASGKRITLLMHRHIMQVQDGLDIDHANHNTLDNRRANLRVCTRSQNLGNSRKRAGLSSRFKGVSWSSNHKLWRAEICVRGKRTILGMFASELDAAKAYADAAVQSFGSFANTQERNR